MSDINLTNQEDIFYKKPNKKETKKEVEKEIIEKTEKEVNIKKDIPLNYIPIKLDSLGKLSAPYELHFRNFSMDEILHLSKYKEEDILEELLYCLNKMVFEDFDCALLNDKELEEIMMTLYLTFWGSYIDGFTYHIKTEEEIENEFKKEKKIYDKNDIKKVLNNKKNIGEAKIDIKKINTICISEKFKEPIRITINNKGYRFILPRLKNLIVAKNYIKNKYKNETMKFSNLENILKKNDDIDKQLDNIEDENEKIKLINKKEKIDIDLLNEYNTYINNKGYDYLKVYECQCIYGDETKNFNLQEQIDNFSKIGMEYWRAYEEITKEYAKFGLQEEVEFFCNVDHVEKIRRFNFRFMDFIPSVESPEPQKYNVSFGD